MRKSLIIAVLIGVVATPVFADDAGVHVVPVVAGVTIGENHNRDGDGTTTIIKEREPHDIATGIKKEMRMPIEKRPSSIKTTTTEIARLRTY